MPSTESPSLCSRFYQHRIPHYIYHGTFTFNLLVLFTVRRYALHGLCDRNSVCLSVCHTRGLCPHGSTYDHDFFTIWEPRHSSFWGYQVHPKIRRGSPRARALNEVGVGTNWRFSTNKPPYLRNGRLLLITNRKSNTRFRLVPKSTTLVDPDMSLDGNYPLRCITRVCFGANH